MFKNVEISTAPFLLFCRNKCFRDFYMISMGKQIDYLEYEGVVWLLCHIINNVYHNFILIYI